jgi:hypothetical protein
MLLEFSFQILPFIRPIFYFLYKIKNAINLEDLRNLIKFCLDIFNLRSDFYIIETF